jgi:hypothetical protein
MGKYAKENRGEKTNMEYERRLDASILQHSGIWGAVNEAVLNIIHKKKNPKNPQKVLSTSVTQPDLNK